MVDYYWHVALNLYAMSFYWHVDVHVFIISVQSIDEGIVKEYIKHMNEYYPLIEPVNVNQA